MLEFFGTLFILGTIWFWASAIVFFFIMLVLTENDYDWSAGLLLVAFFFALLHYNPLTLDLSIISVILFVGVYFAVGGLWSFIKWFSHLHEHADKFRTFKERWLKNYNESHQNHKMDMKSKLKIELDNHNYQNFRKALANDRIVQLSESIIPDWRNKKSKITSWIMWWPMSMFWTLLNDPLVRLVNWIYKYFGNMYERMANSIYAKVGISPED